MDARLHKVAVIGLGRFGAHLARTLSSTGVEVIGIDRNSRVVDELRDDVTLAVRMDSTDEEALKAQGVHQVDVAIVGIGEDFESSALTVATLKGLGVKRIIARAENDIQARILNRVGADEVVLPERESAVRWAQRLMLPNFKQYVELGEGHSLVYSVAPREFHNKTLLDLDLRNRYGVNLIAIERAGAPGQAESTSGGSVSIVAVPRADTVILSSDVLVLVGSNENLRNLPRE